MNPQHRLLGLALALLLAGCAGKTTPPSAPPTAIGATPAIEAVAESETHGASLTTHVETEISADLAAAQDPGKAAVAATTTAHADQAPDQPPASASVAEATSAEDDFNLLYGQPEYDAAYSKLPPGISVAPSYDPWEPFNRRVHTFNNFIDKVLATPLARAYVAVVPRPVRLGISNFFNNLSQPISSLNALLQGRPSDAGFAVIRFVINISVGIGGLFDPASAMKVPYINEDFGQTLAVWGWRTSRYVELPVFGPRTVRDIFGMVGDRPLSPYPHIRNTDTRFALQALQLADIRSRLFSIDSLREGASDEYALYRDAWLQRRNYQIMRDLDRPTEQHHDLPDYLDEPEDNPSIPVDAIPVQVRP
ncbi:MAG: MlaA family lipoprotein [Pseudomonadota bacterium]|nr:MlaA family lipoprotein [Pseudomonadota bacterium]